jgi:hypothetical protein
MALACYDSPTMQRVVRLWDVPRDRERGHWPMRQNACGSPREWSGALALSPDGDLLAVDAGPPHTLVVRETITGRRLKKSVEPLPRPVHSMTFSPGQRMLALTMVSDGAVYLWELASGRLRRRFEGHLGDAVGLAFSPDGRLLASGSSDTTALVWDAYESDPAPADRDPEALWVRLADGDAAQAYRAVCALVADPSRAVPLLRRRLHPVQQPRPAELDQLLADLDSDHFDVRRRAAGELGRLDDLAEPALWRALEGRPSIEVRRRLTELLDRLHADGLSGEAVRTVRAVEVLERIGTADARRLLESLAGGPQGARLTREAKAALDHLARRPAAP